MFLDRLFYWEATADSMFLAPGNIITAVNSESVVRFGYAEAAYLGFKHHFKFGKGE